jgi:hypothetical protein
MTRSYGNQMLAGVAAPLIFGVIGSLTGLGEPSKAAQAAPVAVAAPAAPVAPTAPSAPVAPVAPAAVLAPATPIDASDWHATVRNFAAQHFKNPAWGYSHSMRDYALARELAAADHVKLDDDILFAAAYLHDMAAFPPWENEKLDHSDVAAGIVDSVLKGTGFPMAKIDAVRAATPTVRRRSR